MAAYRQQYKVPAYFVIGAESPEEAAEAAQLFTKHVKFLVEDFDCTFYVDLTHAPVPHAEED